MKSIFLLASAILIMGCSSTKSANSSSTPIYVPNTKKEVEEIYTQKETKPATEILAQDSSTYKEPEKLTEKSIDKKEEVKKEKSIYNIAVVFPFSTEKVPLNYTPYQLDTNIYLSTATQKALDFYMGAKLATEDIKTQKKINLFFLDDMGNDYNTKKVLNERPFPDVDIIVGNYSNQILKYSKTYKIPLFCPFESDITTEPYEQLNFATTSQRELSNYILKSLLGNYPEASVYIVQDLNDDSSKYLIHSAQKFLKEEYNIIPTILTNTSYFLKDNGDTTSTFESASSSIVFFASNKETFVKSTLPKFQSNISPTYILGTSYWINWKGLDAGNSTSSKIFIPTQEIAKVNTNYKENFSSRFLNEFQKTDNSDVYLGYDLMMYLFAGLDNDVILEHPSTAFLGVKPIQYNFEFVPSITNGEIQNFQNNKISIYQFERGKFVLTNWQK
ncbi:MAG: hypothetical protein LC105_04965 [Chitinophagales bacterium]|nr:hypothetical protein [Chitinophagales bacterium]MCZ2393186.1 hypothetical protein [Chitinophagales bacterium]